MKLLITDLTEMGGGRCCVAGWCASEGRMVRPLPGGQNWTGPNIASGRVEPGAWLRVEPVAIPRSGAYPHLSEDTPIDAGAVSRVAGPSVDWTGDGSPPSYSNVQEAFDRNVQVHRTYRGTKKGAFVPKGTQVRSLSAIKLRRSAIEFFESDYQGVKKLRAFVSDREGQYDLPVAAKGLKEHYRNGGVDDLDAQLPSAGWLHIRLGLAREQQSRPGECTVMINGVYW